MDVTVKQNIIKCKIANSKNEIVPVSEKGIGVENVKKRLIFLYPGKHELKIKDEGDFFVVSLLVELVNNKLEHSIANVVYLPVAKKALP